MATNTDFLRFSAYSIKDLITRKLAQDTKFTDQIYEGSNLAVLIDIFSYMAQCMLYSLNNAAAESMFADTQIYENMNRLCKFIGYHPRGCGTSVAEFTLNNANSLYEGQKIPKYSYIDTNLTDVNGKKIYYSTIDTQIVSTNENYSCLFYNGIWKLYSSVYTSSGDQYQTFTLDGLVSDINKNKFIPNNGIHVYVYDNDTFYFYQCVNQGLFTDNNITNGTKIYSSTDQICDLRLNENKTYEITFGNGLNGKIPPKDSQIYIFYLDGNGLNGKIDQLAVQNAKISSNNNRLGISDKLYSKIIGAIDNSSNLNSMSWTNYSSSSEFVEEESVEDIRRNAPEWFKTGNRLVTESDYEYFFKIKNNNLIIDVVCENNWKYISNFYKWLYELSFNGNYVKYKKRETTETSYYINQYKLAKYDLKWADACSQNSIYLWIKMKNNSDICKQLFNQELNPIKTLTQDIVYLEPLTVYFAFCAEPVENIITNLVDYAEFESKFKQNNNSYIEITLDENSIYSTFDVKIQVAQILREFFNADNQLLNATIDYNIVMNKIYQISSVVNVRTITKSINGLTYIQPGLSFATWTTDVIDQGDDLEISNTLKQLKSFQFPKLYNEQDIENMITVIRPTLNNIAIQSI